MISIPLFKMSQVPERWPVRVMSHDWNCVTVRNPEAWDTQAGYSSGGWWNHAFGWSYADSTPIPVVSVERLEELLTDVDEWCDEDGWQHAVDAIQELINEARQGAQ